MTDAAPRATSPDDLLALENQVCFALAVASRSVIGMYRPLLEPMGLTHPQYLVMLALWERGPHSVRALGEALRLEPATLSPLLKRLEALGYVRRGRDPEDDRALRIELTPSGRALRAQALEVPPAVMKLLDMDVAELASLRDTLHALIAAVESAPARA
ncbi:MarR family transcriptional regulator [Gryllotalpicola koreensis]|uniref:MarR family transcriptional regulator n=1 Tax=Gryllotalpicola koreensis TaxID=993086 RepID=A0ABP8A9W7_9MICO